MCPWQTPHELDDDSHVQLLAVWTNTLTWNEEGLINLDFKCGLQDSERYMAWIDADFDLRNRTSASDTVHALQQYRVVQLRSESTDPGPADEAAS